MGLVLGSSCTTKPASRHPSIFLAFLLSCAITPALLRPHLLVLYCTYPSSIAAQPTFPFHDIKNLCRCQTRLANHTVELGNDYLRLTTEPSSRPRFTPSPPSNQTEEASKPRTPRPPTSSKEGPPTRTIPSIHLSVFCMN